MDRNEITEILESGSHPVHHLSANESQVSPNYQGLMRLAESSSDPDGMNMEDIMRLTSERNKNGLKAFTVALAKQELTRVVKLIDALSKLEDNLIKKVNEEGDKLDPGTVAYLIRTLQGSFDRSMELINMVNGDQEYFQVLVEQNNNIIQNNHIVATSLADQDSREKVRELIGAIQSHLATSEKTID